MDMGICDRKARPRYTESYAAPYPGHRARSPAGDFANRRHELRRPLPGSCGALQPATACRNAARMDTCLLLSVRSYILRCGRGIGFKRLPAGYRVNSA